MVKPERRTKTDIAAAATIAVVVAVAASLIWWTSDARATISRPAAVAVPTPAPAREVPTSLKQLWTAASPATRVPVVVGGTVATGDGRQVDGRDPATGESLWSYARDTDLCGVTWVYHYAVAVYRYDRGCGQVSTIDGSTGRRGAARSGYADPRVRLFSDGTTVLSAGDTRLELWRSDMVRMLAYGEIDARVKPSNRGLQSGCTLESAAASWRPYRCLKRVRTRLTCGLCCYARARRTTSPSSALSRNRGSGRVRAPGYWWYRRTTPPCTCLQDQARNREST
ncbi:hypothetical alanine valine rich protein [Mycobacterium tuberculosis]|nr:hypothetical alanine valine rich protein [Mycobacterium tuberculosis]CKR91720.1 hypothetical alanine valine rich protein [Mycobacterium tuberculosis]